jgi:glutathione synthase/RimK-type ligase-like ATP-grasp enzyme
VKAAGPRREANVMGCATGSDPGFVVIGHPAHRRVTMFQAALAAQGLAPARVIAWAEVAEPGAPARLLAGLGRAILRIDSAGEDDAIDRAFLGRGAAAARAGGYPAIAAAALAALPFERGQILFPRQHHLGFVAVLDEIAAAVAGQPELVVVQPPSAIARLFDKRATSLRWHAMGIPVPDILPGGVVRDPDDLRARMEALGWQSVFVKLTSGSSASCLAVFVHRASDEHVMTTIEDTGIARYHTRRIQRLNDRARIDRVLGFILGEGAQVERTIPKARLANRYIDCRVLTIDGEPAFVVVRAATHPITNLNLGGQRGDLRALRAVVPPAAWDAAMASCRAVQQTSGAFHVGVDLMFEPGFAAHRVIEGNAFGDLLPNLVRDGLDVYGWQIRRLRDHG